MSREELSDSILLVLRQDFACLMLQEECHELLFLKLLFVLKVGISCDLLSVVEIVFDFLVEDLLHDVFERGETNLSELRVVVGTLNDLHDEGDM